MLGKFDRSFSYNEVVYWNNLNEEIKNVNIHKVLQKHIKKHILII